MGYLMLLLVGLGFGWVGATVTVATTSQPTIATGTTPTTTETNVTEATCSANNATCNNVTQSTPKQEENTNTKWPNLQLQPKYYKFKMSNQSVCTCDLHNRFCDINCCCDKDCSLDEKQVFSSCDDARTLPSANSNYCNYIQYVYNNRTLYEWEVQQNSLFCITKTNLPAHYYKQKKKIISNPLNANDVIKESPVYQWHHHQQIDENASKNVTNRSALVGDQIFMLKNYTTPQRFELPDNFATPDCIITKPIEYLKDTTTTCRQTLHYQNNQLMVQLYADANTNVTVLSSLRFLNSSLKHYEGCPKNVCIPLSNIKQCDLSSCWNLTKDIKTECNPKACTNIVTAIKYKFTHNGTNGIQRVDIELTLNNVTMPPIYIYQQHSVVFLWMNQSECNYTDFRSGNPGYQEGKPILIGTLITVVNTTTNSTTNKTTTTQMKTLHRNHESFTDNFLVLPKNVHGKCVLSNHTFEPVEFGYNLLTKCVHGQGFITKTNVTANETCWLLQNNILAYWFLDVDLKINKNTTRNHTFGHFGNAQNSNVNDWGHFLFDVFPDELLNVTFGQLLGNNNIECQNISTGIKYNVFYERMQYEQNRIAAIYVEFIDLKRKVLLNVVNHTNVFSNVRLTSEIMFYDVTGARNMKYVDPPSLSIKLPYDFFYPFVKIDNGANGFSHCFWIILFGVICDLHYAIYLGI